MGLGASSRLKHREVAKGSYKNCKQRTSWFHPVQVQSARSHLQEAISGDVGGFVGPLMTPMSLSSAKVKV